MVVIQKLLAILPCLYGTIGADTPEISGEVNLDLSTSMQLLQRLKEEYRLANPKKFNYQTAQLDTNSTLFHKYFTSYNLVDNDIARYQGDNTTEGYMIEIDLDDKGPDGSYFRKKEKLFFSHDEIDSYGKINFDLPFGPIKEIDDENYSVISDTNLKVRKAYEELENYAFNSKDGETLCMIADINALGLYNTLNVDLALQTYHEVINLEEVDIEYEAHAHFMLGVIYSTGLFGKVEKDAAKGMIHYQMAADLGSIQAEMTLAHKFMFGINTAENLEHAFYYFSLVKEKIEKKISLNKVKVEKTPLNFANELIFNVNLDKFDVSWADVAGGLYDTSTQAIDTIRYFETFEDYAWIKNQNTPSDEDDYSLGDDTTLDGYHILYFFTQKYYTGDYLQSRDYGKAFKYADICVRSGIEEPEIRDLLQNSPNNKTIVSSSTILGTEFFIQIDEDGGIKPLQEFVGRCAQYLGHMYLRGEGVDVNYEEAAKYINIARELTSHQVFINDFALMKYYGLGVPQDREEAIQIFDQGRKFASSRYYRGIAAIDKSREKMSSLNPYVIPEDAYRMLLTSSPYNSMAKRELISVFENRLYNIPNQNIAGVYNSYVKLFNDMYFDFKIPFYSFINANISDSSSTELWTSISTLAIASELGYADAQASLGTILYPTLGNFKSKKYRNDPQNQDVYTAKRFEEALFYLEVSARHYNRDSIIFLGDMHYNGLYSSVEEQLRDDPLYNRPFWQYMMPLASAEDGVQDNWLIFIAKKVFDFFKFGLQPIYLRLKNYYYVEDIIAVKGEEQRAIIPRDFNKAIAYYHEAASLGSHLASFNVGWAYEYGIGVTQDLHLAKRYYDLSLERSSDGYLPVMYAVYRIRLKAFLWSMLGFDGRGIRELNLDRKTWGQRIRMIIGWVSNPE